MKKLNYSLLFVILTTCFACGPYSFTGADTGDAKSFQVNYFQNMSILVEPGLDRDFTLALQDIIINQTNLSLVNSNADLVYEGEITGYRISPTTATADNTAAQNRLTIKVNVRFYNKVKSEDEIAFYVGDTHCYSVIYEGRKERERADEESPVINPRDYIDQMLTRTHDESNKKPLNKAYRSDLKEDAEKSNLFRTVVA